MLAGLGEGGQLRHIGWCRDDFEPCRLGPTNLFGNKICMGIEHTVTTQAAIDAKLADVRFFCLTVMAMLYQAFGLISDPTVTNTPSGRR